MKKTALQEAQETIDELEEELDETRDLLYKERDKTKHLRGCLLGLLMEDEHWEEV